MRTNSSSLLLIVGFLSVAACGDEARIVGPANPVLLSGALGADDSSFIVLYHQSTPGPTALTAALSRQHGFVVVNGYDRVVKGFSADLSAAVRAVLESHPAVALVTPNTTLRHAFPYWVQNDAPFSLDRLDTRLLSTDSRYEYTDRAGGVSIYIVDSGIQASHADFRGWWGGSRVQLFWDVNGGSGGDDCDHGTAVASAAGGNIAGVAKDVTIQNVKAHRIGASCFDNAFTAGDIIDALNEIGNRYTHPAVVNLSLFGDPNPALDSAVRSISVNHNIPIVVAAGNVNANACNYSPARVLHAITVGGSNTVDSRLHNVFSGTSSAWGTCLDLWAPAWVYVATTTVPDGFRQDEGTSGSAPLVAGVVAMFRARYPSVGYEEVRNKLVSLATDKVIDQDAAHNSPNKLLFSRWVVAGIVGPSFTTPNTWDEFYGNVQGGKGPYYYEWLKDGWPVPNCTGVDFNLCAVQSGYSTYYLELRVTDVTGASWTDAQYINVH